MEAITIGALLESAIAAEEALAELGETIEDEWSYVNDLCRAWTDRLDEVAAAPIGAREAPPAIVDAIGLAIEEAALVRDPHRAIDWLSTFPQVVLLAAESLA